MYVYYTLFIVYQRGFALRMIRFREVVEIECQNLSEGGQKRGLEMEIKYTKAR